MSWGIKITVLYLGFVALILTLVFTCFANKTELEYTDYYAKELKFQDQIDARNNADALSMPIEHAVKERSVEIVIPKEILNGALKGTVHFLRPSDAALDKTIVLNPDAEGRQIIQEEGFSRGVYKMRISLSSLGKNYYKEAIINFK